MQQTSTLFLSLIHARYREGEIHVLRGSFLLEQYFDKGIFTKMVVGVGPLSFLNLSIKNELSSVYGQC